MKEYKLFVIVCIATILAFWSLHAECEHKNNQDITESESEYIAEESIYDIRVNTSDVDFDELEENSGEFISRTISSLTGDAGINLYSPDIEEYVDMTSDTESEQSEEVVSKSIIAYMEDSILVSYVTNTGRVVNILSWFDRITGDIICSTVCDAGDVETSYSVSGNNLAYIGDIQDEFINSLLGKGYGIFDLCKDSIDVIANDIGDSNSVTAKYVSCGFGRKDVKLVDRIFLLLNYMDIDGNSVQYGIVIKYNLNGNIYDVDIIS